MASYKYRSIITIPAEQARPFQTIAGQGLPKTTYREELDAVHAVSYARSQHRLPAGTTIRIERIRVARERIDPRDAAAGLRAQPPDGPPGSLDALPALRGQRQRHREAHGQVTQVGGDAARSGETRGGPFWSGDHDEHRTRRLPRRPRQG